MTDYASLPIRTPHGLTIRLVDPQDDESVARIIRTVMTEFECVGEGYSIHDPEVDNISANYADARSAFFVVTHKERVLGCGGIGPLHGGPDDTCELRKMYFCKEIRGLGAGKRLLQLCLKYAAQIGYQQCYLETTQRMTSARALYEKMGFRQLECSLGDTGHGSCDAFYLRRLGDNANGILR